MSYVIALAGKGGSGKTTIAALLVRQLKKTKAGSILAVDADPNSNLAEALGVQTGASIGTLIDAVAAHPERIPAGMSKDRFIEYQVQTAIAEGPGFDVLTMGKPEGPGCYCYANTVLRGCMARLINGYDYVIIDNEAGLEHLSRRTTRAADVLLVVANPTAAGLRAAERIHSLAEELKIQLGEKLLLVNCVHGPESGKSFKAGPLKFIGSIPMDPRIEKISRGGTSLLELPESAGSIKALHTSGDAIWH